VYLNPQRTHMFQNICVQYVTLTL